MWTYLNFFGAIGQTFITVNGQICNNNLTIWSHCKRQSGLPQKNRFCEENNLHFNEVQIPKRNFKFLSLKLKIRFCLFLYFKHFLSHFLSPGYMLFYILYLDSHVLSVLVSYSTFSFLSLSVPYTLSHSSHNTLIHITHTHISMFGFEATCSVVSNVLSNRLTNNRLCRQNFQVKWFIRKIFLKVLSVLKL